MIHHNSSNSWNYIQGSASGVNLAIQAKSGENNITCYSDDRTELYYDHSKKLETTSDGITIGGDSGVTGNWQLETYNGSGSCGNVFAGTTGAYLYIQDTGSSEKIGILANGRASITSYKVDDPLVLSTTDSNGTSDRLIIEGDGDIRIPQDNKVLSLGASQDLQIYTDAENGYIKAITANLWLRSDTNIFLSNEAGSEYFLKAANNGASELYYDNSKKLETNSVGILVSGTTLKQQSSGEVSVQIGSTNAGGAAIYFDGDSNGDFIGGDYSWIRHTTSGHLEICADNPSSNGSIYLKVKDGNENAIYCQADGKVELMHNGSSRFETANAGVTVTSGVDGSSPLVVKSTDGTTIANFYESSDADGNNGMLYLQDGSGNTDVKLSTNGPSWFNGGKVGIGTAAPNKKLELLESSNSVAVLRVNRSTDVDSTTRDFIEFYRDATQVGSIKCSNAATTYNTSSDYRLKENEVLISDGITRLKTLKPYRFNFKINPDKTIDGFFAHEVTPAVPEAITGEKDGEEMQGIDQSKLVPLLTAALQEAITKIETLETKVAALEAG